MPNPRPQAIPLAPWRSPLARALHRNRAQPFCRFFQLATLRPSGIPANRTVVFRGFLEDTNQLKIITDHRSEKIEQIARTPQSEACWYFTKTREQFRLTGQLQIVSATTENNDLQKARIQQWQSISDNARSQFTWPTPKGPRTQNPDAFNTDAVDPQHPPDTFTLLLLAPSQVDYLCLKGNPQTRILYHREQTHPETWQTQEVNP